MNDKSENKRALVSSYLALRKVMGILAILFPFVLFFGALIFFGTGIQSSMSRYYHTDMRDVFVGILCAIGFFLLSYKGYKNSPDNLAGNLGSIFAVGVALFPTRPDGVVSASVRLIGYIHNAFAALLFITLAYFSLYLFTRTDPNGTPTPRKLRRNKVYRTSGYIIIVCIVLIAIYQLLPDRVASPIKVFRPVFWLEAIAVVAFGISWFTKGEALSMLNDDPQSPAST